MVFRIIIAFATVTAIGVYFWNPLGAPTWSPMGRFLGFQTYRMPNAGMEPTIAEGEMFVACFNVDPDTIQVGDIVVHFRVGESANLYAKRVAALAGSTVVVRTDTIVIDDSPIDRWFHFGASSPARAQESPPVVVPPEHVYLLGDNLNRSLDSRLLGPIPTSLVVGRLCD